MRLKLTDTEKIETLIEIVKDQQVEIECLKKAFRSIVINVFNDDVGGCKMSIWSGQN